MGDTTALVLDLSWIVQLQEDIVNWFVTLAVLGLDTSAIDILDVSFNALAAIATSFSRWAFEVFKGLCLASLSAGTFGWNLTTSAYFWFWCFHNRWDPFTCWAALAFNHYCFLCVWIADGAGLWFLDQFVVQTYELNAGFSS